MWLDDNRKKIIVNLPELAAAAASNVDQDLYLTVSTPSQGNIHRLYSNLTYHRVCYLNHLKLLFFKWSWVLFPLVSQWYLSGLYQSERLSLQILTYVCMFLFYRTVLQRQCSEVTGVGSKISLKWRKNLNLKNKHFFP